MKYYAAFDISMKETAICIVDESSSIVKEGMVPTDPLKIANFLNKSGVSITQACMESGSLCHWMMSELRKLSVPVICVDARHIAAVLSTTINKTDKNDARGLANALRCKMYREVHPKSLDSIEKSTLLASRRTIVDQRTEITNTIRGLLKSYGIRIVNSATTNKFLDEVRKLITDIPELAKVGLGELLKCAENLHNQIKALNAVVEKIAEDDEQAKLLQTVPGIGSITAVNFLKEIDDPTRFKKSRSVGACLGMTPTQYSSGETHKQGRISKCGSKELRHLLMEAGFVVITRSKKWSKLKAWGMKLMKKIGLKKAALAVGRKLAVIMHKMLITGKEFIYTEEKPENEATITPNNKKDLLKMPATQIIPTEMEFIRMQEAFA
jgi:transposase